MKRKILLILLISATAISCCRLPPMSEKNEGWYYEVENSLRSYSYNHFAPPENMDDLLHYIELKGSLLSSGYVEQSYDFLKKHRKRIIITQMPLKEILEPEEIKEWIEQYNGEGLDDIYTAMFFKNRKPDNLMSFISPHETDCYMEGPFGIINIFDENRDPIKEEIRLDDYSRDLRKRLFTPEVQYWSPAIRWKEKEGYPHKLDYLIVEYTKENGLRDICNCQKIEVSGSTYFEAFADCLQNFMHDHPEISRIILDTYIPME